MQSRRTHGAVTLRSPWASAVIVVLGVLSLLIGSSYFYDPGSGPLVAALFGVPLCAVGAWVTARGLLLRIRVTSDAVALHGMVRTRRLRRDQVSAVGIAEVSAMVGDALTVDFALTDGSQASVGAMAAYQGWIPLARTRAYRHAQVASQVLDVPLSPAVGA
ncbi:hypothetical protein [Cellulomonas citrea]|uniref:hypothetical protein n=1 Tax=Cellulomonas citrea TaxID=1909423 RepID=UPI0013576DA3|nr:hypothetical protein [Cellulomonas citrea]